MIEKGEVNLVLLTKDIAVSIMLLEWLCYTLAFMLFSKDASAHA